MQIHLKRLWTLLHLLCISANVRSQDSLVTDVVLIGTKHTPHKGYHSDSLLKVVVNLKPDVILIEQDSISGIFKTGQFKPIPRWIQYLSRIIFVFNILQKRKRYRKRLEDSCLRGPKSQKLLCH